MPLPDASRLLSLPAETWRALCLRLKAIKLDPAFVGPIVSRGKGSLDALRAPMRVWHARRAAGPAGLAMRLFMLQDPITEADTRTVLGDVPLDALLGAGILTRVDGNKVVSPFTLNLVGPLYIMCDDLTRGDAAVMGAGETTALLCYAGRPTKPVKRVLDVGCGAGTAGLLYAADAESVIGIDINPRAIAMAKANALMNGITNAEFREGDLFAPVSGETFDVVVSQPPFLPRPEGVPQQPHLHGGVRGDELPLRLVSEAPKHLRPGGRAVILVEWPLTKGESLEERVRKAAPGEDLSVLLVQSSETDLDDYATHDSATNAPELGPSFVLAAMARRDHLERMKIDELRLTVTVLQRAATPPGWTSSVVVRGRGVTGAHIDNLVAVRDLLAKGITATLDANLRIFPGTGFQQDRTGVTPGAPAQVMVVLPPEVGAEPIAMSQGTYNLMTLIDRSSSVRVAIEHFSAATGESFEEASQKILPAVSSSLLYGLLEIAT